MNGIAIHDLLVSLAIVAGGALLGVLLYHTVQWMARVADRSPYRIDGMLLRVLGPPSSVLVALLGLNYALYRLPMVQAQFGQWEGAQRAVYVVTGTWVLASLVKNLIRAYALPLAHRTDTDVDERIVQILDMTAVYAIWVGGLLVALRELGIEVTAFFASLGIVGLAVALAARTVLSNVLAGITLTADRNFRVGDRIEVGNYVGDVLEINLHKTVIRTRDNEVVLIPNDVLGKEVIVNHMLPEQKTRIELRIGVGYEADLERATAVLTELIRNVDRILPDPEPEVNVASLDDSAVALQVLAWIDVPRGKRAVRDQIYRRALARFRDEGIDVPFPQRVVHVARGAGDARLVEGTAAGESSPSTKDRPGGDA